MQQHEEISYKHYTEWGKKKKTDTKEPILYDSIYVNFK